MNMAKRAANDDSENVAQKQKNTGKELLSYLVIIIVAFLLAQFWKNFISTKVEVISGSMKDSLQIGDRLIASKLPYIFGEPQRGDIVIFRFPDDETEVFIKRLIGLPGETIEIVDGYVYVDGVLLEEDYVKGSRVGDFGPYFVPEGEYFMLGDNRLHSGDSREWEDKYVSNDQLIGKGLFLYKPEFRKLYNDSAAEKPSNVVGIAVGGMALIVLTVILVLIWRKHSLTKAKRRSDTLQTEERKPEIRKFE